jgi:hypothetical protein
MEYLAELYPNQSLHQNMLLMNLRLSDIGCIVDRSGEFVDISEGINCANLKGYHYEVFGEPFEQPEHGRSAAEIDREWEQLCADVKLVGDVFEREKWKRVIQRRGRIFLDAVVITTHLERRMRTGQPCTSYLVAVGK